MTSDIDIYRVAKIIMEQYKDRASEEASRRMYLFTNNEDHEGASVWRRINQAINFLSSKTENLTKQ